MDLKLLHSLNLRLYQYVVKYSVIHLLSRCMLPLSENKIRSNPCITKNFKNKKSECPVQRIGCVSR